MVIWITGLSGSGKTTLSKNLYKKIKKEHLNTVLLDGDIIRKALSHNYGYTNEERHRGAFQVSGLCKMLDNEELIVICATMSLFHDIQKSNREEIDKYIEVFLDVPMVELQKRDTKNLYKEAISGLRENVVGIDLLYEQPINPEFNFKNITTKDLDNNVSTLFNIIKSELNS